MKHVVIFLVIFLALAGAARAQDICPTLDECKQRLEKTLTDLDAKDAQLANAGDQLATVKSEVTEHKALEAALLQVIKDFAEADTKEKKKSWWAKTKQVMEKVLDKATDPGTLSLIATILILEKAR